MVLAGCASRQDAVTSSGKDYLVALSTLELDPDKHNQREYYQTVVGKMKSWLEPIQDPNELKMLFYQVYEKWRSQPETSQDRLTWIDPFHESRNLIMYRLGDLKTPEAARIMVEIFCDTTVQWGAHPREMAADAILRCGKPALPFLKQNEKNNSDAATLVKWIESGKTRF